MYIIVSKYQPWRVWLVSQPVRSLLVDSLDAPVVLTPHLFFFLLSSEEDQPETLAMSFRGTTLSYIL